MASTPANRLASTYLAWLDTAIGNLTPPSGHMANDRHKGMREAYVKARGEFVWLRSQEKHEAAEAAWVQSWNERPNK